MVAEGAELLASARDTPLEPDVLVPAGPDERWVLLYTRSRCEKRVAHLCTRSGARHYLPLQEHWTGRDRRGRSYSLPLFPSYVFACLTDDQQQQMLAMQGTVRVIPVRHPGRLLAELREIRRLLATGAPVWAGPALGKGTRVRVVRGPLAGLAGMVVDLRPRAGRYELVINVTILGRAVATEVDAMAVEPMGQPFAAERLVQEEAAA